MERRESPNSTNTAPLKLIAMALAACASGPQVIPNSFDAYAALQDARKDVEADYEGIQKDGSAVACSSVSNMYEIDILSAKVRRMLNLDATALTNEQFSEARPVRGYIENGRSEAEELNISPKPYIKCVRAYDINNTRAPSGARNSRPR